MKINISRVEVFIIVFLILCGRVTYKRADRYVEKQEALIYQNYKCNLWSGMNDDMPSDVEVNYLNTCIMYLHDAEKRRAECRDKEFIR